MIKDTEIKSEVILNLYLIVYERRYKNYGRSFYSTISSYHIIEPLIGNWDSGAIDIGFQWQTSFNDVVQPLSSAYAAKTFAAIRPTGRIVQRFSVFSLYPQLRPAQYEIIRFLNKRLETV